MCVDSLKIFQSEGNIEARKNWDNGCTGAWISRDSSKYFLSFWFGHFFQLSILSYFKMLYTEH